MICYFKILIAGIVVDEKVAAIPDVGITVAGINQALIAQRNFADRARGLAWHSSAVARMGSGATSR